MRPRFSPRSEPGTTDTTLTFSTLLSFFCSRDPFAILHHKSRCSSEFTESTPTSVPHLPFTGEGKTHHPCSWSWHPMHSATVAIRYAESGPILAPPNRLKWRACSTRSKRMAHSSWLCLNVNDHSRIVREPSVPAAVIRLVRTQAGECVHR